MKASTIKQFFKNLGIPVRVRSSKHFVSVWIQRNNAGVPHSPLSYSYSFPVEIRERLLKIIYGDKWVSEPGREGNAGNISAYSIACRANELEQLMQEFFTNPLQFGTQSDTLNK